METRLSYNFPVYTKVYFGVGKLNELHTLSMPGKKALLVISNGKSIRDNGYLERTISQLEQAKVEYVIFDKVQANPTKENVEEGAQLAQKEKCDFVVALGGGSVMDSAKIIALNATNRGDLWNYVFAGSGLRKPATNAPLPWIAISTTAGTGSEVDAVGVITNAAMKEKLGIFGACAIYAIVDPELMLSVPPKYTAFQGFDALFHSLEGYICRSSNLFSDMVQEAAITNIAQFLPIAFRDGNDIEARSRMAFANTMSGYSMDTATCTIEHAIEHAMSAYHENLPHGAGLIMISKAYFSTIIRQHVVDERFVRMARMLGKSDATKPEEFVDALVALQKQCEVDDLKMSDYGIVPDEFFDMATNALTIMERLATQDHQTLTHSEVIDILRQSYR